MLNQIEDEIAEIRSRAKTLLEEYQRLKCLEKSEELKKYGLSDGDTVMYRHPFGDKYVEDRCRIEVSVRECDSFYSEGIIKLRPYKKDGGLASRAFNAYGYEFEEGNVRRFVY